MPWTTPTLRTVRQMVRGEITAKVAGASFVGNSVLRVLADAQAALAHLVLRYLDWLARQFLPDTAEAEWLDRHGDIWLVNADGTIGRKAGTLAAGSVTMTGVPGTIVPIATELQANVFYETTAQILLGSSATAVAVIALDPGTAGNMNPGDVLSFTTAIAGVDGTATVVSLTGGADDETDDELRQRILFRIQQPPMGGDADDFVQWALAVPGVTRAWCYPLEMGIGTVTVRFMCDDLRAEWGGFPLPIDVLNVETYIDSVRPVAVKDVFVLAPLPMPVDLTIFSLTEDTEAMRQAIEEAVELELLMRASPGGTVYRSWIEEAIMSVVGDATYELTFTTLVMPSPGHLGVLGTIQYAGG